MRLVLDAEAVNALLEPRHAARPAVRRNLAIAARLGREVCIAEVTLAELYRGAARSRALDALLGRMEEAISTRATDRTLARLVGALLHGAGAGSELLADAHAVAVVVEAGGGVVVTGDPGDLRRLAADDPRVVVVAI